MGNFGWNNGDANRGGILFGKTSGEGYFYVKLRNVTTFGMNNFNSLEGSIMYLTATSDNNEVSIVNCKFDGDNYLGSGQFFYIKSNGWFGRAGLITLVNSVF